MIPPVHEAVGCTVLAWGMLYGLTPAERAVLLLAALGTLRSDLPLARNVSATTVKKQVQQICAKCHANSLASLVTDVLRQTLVTVLTQPTCS